MILTTAEVRADYLKAIAEMGFTHEQVRAITENEADRIPFPGDHGVVVKPSLIDGNGLFATRRFVSGNVIAPARFEMKRTPAGRFTNHSPQPNALFCPRSGEIDLVALVAIEPGEEILVDYRQAREAAAVADSQLKERKAA